MWINYPTLWLSSLPLSGHSASSEHTCPHPTTESVCITILRNHLVFFSVRHPLALNVSADELSHRKGFLLQVSLVFLLLRYIPEVDLTDVLVDPLVFLDSDIF